MPEEYRICPVILSIGSNGDAVISSALAGFAAEEADEEDNGSRDEEQMDCHSRDIDHQHAYHPNQ